MIRCKKHGVSPFVESCKHVRALITHKASDLVKTITTGVYSMLVCQDCLKEHQLNKYLLTDIPRPKPFIDEPDAFWEDVDLAYEKMSPREHWCCTCYQELLRT